MKSFVAATLATFGASQTVYYSETGQIITDKITKSTCKHTIELYGKAVTNTI